jgi:hypothetical protein
MAVRECNRCAGVTKSGKECSRNTCMYPFYCWQHSPVLAIRDSTIPEAGKGLFAKVDMDKDDEIPFGGTRLSKKKVEELWPGDQVAPYVLCHEDRKYCYDASSTQSGFARYANDAKHANKRPNALFEWNQHEQPILRLVKPISKDKEILTDYGDNYWGVDPNKEGIVKPAPRKKGQKKTGPKKQKAVSASSTSSTSLKLPPEAPVPSTNSKYDYFDDTEWLDEDTMDSCVGYFNNEIEHRNKSHNTVVWPVRFYMSFRKDYKHFLDEKPDAAKRMKKYNLFIDDTTDLFYIPMFINGNHWIVARLSFVRRREGIDYYDPLGGELAKEYKTDLVNIYSYLLGKSKFTTKQVGDIVLRRQRNFNDCGIYSLIFILEDGVYGFWRTPSSDPKRVTAILPGSTDAGRRELVREIMDCAIDNKEAVGKWAEDKKKKKKKGKKGTKA